MGVGSSDEYNAERDMTLVNMLVKGLCPGTNKNSGIDQFAFLYRGKLVKLGVPLVVAVALAYTAHASDFNKSDFNGEGKLNVGNYIPMVANPSNNTSSATALHTQYGNVERITPKQNTEKVTTSSAPPTPGNFFGLYGAILDETDWMGGSISDAVVSMFFYNKTTGEVAAVMQAEVGNTKEKLQYVVKGINRSVVNRNDIVRVKFNGTFGGINGSNNWTVVYPVEGSEYVQVPITYIPPVDPRIDDFAVSLFAHGTDNKTNDANVIANRSGADSKYTLQINGTDVATNETFSIDKINEIYENLSEGWNNITLKIESNDGKNSTISKDVFIDTIPPYIINKTVNVFYDDRIEFLMNISENANWTLYRNDLKIKSNKTNSTLNPITFAIKDALNPGTNKYTLDLKDKLGNVRLKIDLGTFERKKTVVDTPSSGGSGGSGGGGGGQIIEPPENIDTKYRESKDLFPGNVTIYNFERNGDVSGIQLNVKSHKKETDVDVSLLKLTTISNSSVPNKTREELYEEIKNDNNIIGTPIEFIRLKIGPNYFFDADNNNIEDVKFIQKFDETKFSHEAVRNGEVHAYSYYFNKDGKLNIEKLPISLYNEQEPNKTTVQITIPHNLDFFMTESLSTPTPTSTQKIMQPTTTETIRSPIEAKKTPGLGVLGAVATIGAIALAPKKPNFKKVLGRKINL